MVGSIFELLQMSLTLDGSSWVLIAASRQAGGVAVANLAIAKKARTNADLENMLRAVDRLKFVIRSKLQVGEGYRIVIGVVWTWSSRQWQVICKE